MTVAKIIVRLFIRTGKSTPLEAFARGKNVIISNYPGSREQLKKFATYFNTKKKGVLKKKY